LNRIKSGEVRNGVEAREETVGIRKLSLMRSRGRVHGLEIAMDPSTAWRKDQVVVSQLEKIQSLHKSV